MRVAEVLSACLTLGWFHLGGLLAQVQVDHCLSSVVWDKALYFEYTSVNNDCSGTRYTTTYTIRNTTFHVTALLCSPTRYKLLLKESSIWATNYRDIVDTDGDGEDHCELLGMEKDQIHQVRLGPPIEDLIEAVGFFRDGWGEPFRRGVAHLDNSPRWYECGISIPSSRKIYMKGCENKEGDNAEKADSSQAVGLSVGVLVGIIIGSVLGGTCLIYVTVRCIIYIKSKRCIQRQEEPPPRTRPHEVPLAPRPIAPSAPVTPSTPARTPPAPSSGAPSAPPSRAQNERAPPAYEEAEKYPLVRAAEAAPPSYKHLDHV